MYSPNEVIAIDYKNELKFFRDISMKCNKIFLIYLCPWTMLYSVPWRCERYNIVHDTIELCCLFLWARQAVTICKTTAKRFWRGRCATTIRRREQRSRLDKCGSCCIKPMANCVHFSARWQDLRARISITWPTVTHESDLQKDRKSGDWEPKHMACRRTSRTDIKRPCAV